MAARLSEVSRELSDKLLGEVDFEDRLTGWSMRQMSGSRPIFIYSLQEVADFIKIPELDKLFSAGSGESIGYLDITKLATWIRETLGDKELAEAIEDVRARTVSYAKGATEARTLIHHRLKQCLRS